MKVLVVSRSGEGLHLVDQFCKAGLDVRFCVVQDPGTELLRGVAERVSSPEEAAEWGPDVVAFTFSDPALVATIQLRYGIPVLGGHPAAQLLEYPSEGPAGQNLKDAGILLAEGEADGEFTVTEAAWFHYDRFLDPLCYAFVEDRFLPGNLGPRTGYEGHVAVGSLNRKEKLHRIGLKRLTLLLQSAKYRGPLVATYSLQDGKLLLKQLSFSVPAYFLLTTGLACPKAILAGEDAPLATGFTGWSGLVRLSLPPHPMPHVPAIDGQIEHKIRRTLLQANARGVVCRRPEIVEDCRTVGPNMQMGDSDIETAGVTATPGYIYAVGCDPRSTNQALRRNIFSFNGNFQARIDIGDAAAVRLDHLRTHGFLVPYDP